MEPDDYVATTKWLKAALKADEPLPWGYVAQGADGLPVFLVHKLEATVDKGLREAKPSAKDKRYAAGVLKRDARGDLVLAVQDGPVQPNALKLALRDEISVDPGFKAVKALLRNLDVVAEAKAVKKVVPPPKPESAEGGGKADGADPLLAMLERIRGNLAKLASSPAAIDDDKLNGLLERIAEYVAKGGEQDVTDAERVVRGELRARTIARDASARVAEAQVRLKRLADAVGAAGRGYKAELPATTEELERLLAGLTRLRASLATELGLG